MNQDNRSRRNPADNRSAGAPRRSDLHNNLRSQTPLNRQYDQRRRAPSEPGTVRRQARQYFRIKEDEKTVRKKSHVGSRILLVLICYAILMPVSLLLVYLWLPHHSTQETKDYIYQVGPDGAYVSRRTYSWDVVRSGDVYYLDMNSLASYCDLATTGDLSLMQYTVKETGETLSLVIGQSVAFVNGIQERTGGNVYLKNNTVYIPLDFVNRCFNGVNAIVDTAKNKITIVRETDENKQPVTISFPYKPVEELNAIRFADLDSTTQQYILWQTQEVNGTNTGFPDLP